MSGKSNSMPSNYLEFNFDKKVHFRPPISTNSNRNEHIRESSINESSTKSPSQQYLPPKPVQNTTSSRDTLRPVDTRSNRIDSQSNNYSITEDDDDDDDDDDDEEEEEEDSSISSGGNVSDSSNSSIQQRHSTSAAPIPVQPPPPRRGTEEEVSSMIRELRALVVQLKENSLSLTPTATTFKASAVPVVVAEEGGGGPQRVLDKPVTASLGSNAKPVSEYSPPLVSTSSTDPVAPSSSIRGDLDGIAILVGSDTTTTTTTPAGVSIISGPPPPPLDIISPTYLVSPPVHPVVDDSDRPLNPAAAAAAVSEPVNPLPSSLSSSQQSVEPAPAPAMMKASPLPRQPLPSAPAVAVAAVPGDSDPASGSAEVDLSGTWTSSSPAPSPRASAATSSPNTHIHIHNHLAPSTQPLAQPQQQQQQQRQQPIFPARFSQPVVDGSNWTVQRVDEYGRVRPHQLPERMDDPYGRRRGRDPSSNHRSSAEDFNFDAIRNSVDLSGLSLQVIK